MSSDMPPRLPLVPARLPPSLAEQRLDRLLSYLQRRLRLIDLLWGTILGLGLVAASGSVLVLEDAHKTMAVIEE